MTTPQPAPAPAPAAPVETPAAAPAASAPAPAPAPVLQVPTNTGEPQLDILVAEDNEVNQMVITHLLEEIGLSFKIVENGRLAVEAYQANRPRMILMDVSMPEMNGHQATEAIRELEKTTGVHVPIIGCTAHALTGDKEKCLEHGMDDYLSKPISPNALKAKIESWNQQLQKASA